MLNQLLMHHFIQIGAHHSQDVDLMSLELAPTNVQISFIQKVSEIHLQQDSVQTIYRSQTEIVQEVV
jgi:hypothetical protein